ncbi:MAG: protein kinase [Myxococcales bacterium]
MTGLERPHSHPPRAAPAGSDDQDSASTPLFAGRYRMLEEIAAGGIGVVSRAEDAANGRVVALKQLRGESARNPRMVSLFEREYQTLAHLAHPYIIRVHEYGFSPAGPYYTMELLEGGSDLQHGGPLPYREACRCLRDVATSLALLHARRLVHRDVTPRNVYRTKEGRCKLLDFGALASFGISSDVVGTAPFVAPEVLRQEPLDQRADLYALGALAYWLLTGQHAFAARRMDDLFELWRRRPVLPSKHQASIPAELDELIMTLLALEPGARPRHAVEVIERLNVIGQLPAEPRAEAEVLAQAYLTNPELVGRDALLARFDAALEGAAGGIPNRSLIVGDSGFGRTRLLAEAALKARLAGFAVLRAEASGSHPFATAQVLAHALLDAFPEQARESARSHAQVLANLGPELAQRLGVATNSRGSPTPGDWSEQIADAMGRWFHRMTADHCLLVAVDNLERADEASLALLASLRSSKRSSRLWVLGSCTTVEPHATSVGLKALIRVSQVHRLEPLSESATAELLRSIFGDATNLVRCSRWIYDLTAGSPLHCIELVDTLLAEGGLRFVDGIWLLPGSRPELTLSSDLAQAMTGRLKGLGADALSLAQTLSLVKVTLSLELCLALAQRFARSGYLILDDLVQSRVLVVEGKLCRFSSDALRQTLALRMAAEELVVHHRQIGEVLLALPTLDSFMKMQAGNHLMEGGDRLRGAECVYSVAARAMEEMNDSIHQFAPILARAHDELELLGSSRYMRLPLLLGLADASFYADWRWAQRYGAKTLEAIEDVLGITLARKLGRFLGRKLAILVSLMLATLRYVVLRPRVHPSVGELFIRSIGSASALVGAAAAVFDRETAARATKTLRALSWLGKRSALDGAHDFSVALLSLIEDHPHESSARFAELAARFSDTQNYREISQTSRILWIGGARYALGVNQTMKATDEAIDTAKALAHGGIAMHRMLAHQLRIAYHVCRGELEKAEQYRETVEAYAILVGSAWQAEIWESAVSSVLYARSGDVVNAKRVSELFADLSQRIPSLALYAAQTRAGLAYARGEYALAQSLWEEALSGKQPRSFAGWLLARANLAACHNGQGQFEEAEQLCRDSAGTARPGDAEYPLMSLWLHIEWAMAEAGLGKGTAAAARLDVLLESGMTGENPFLRGSLHAARAQVAFRMGDEQAFERQASQVRHWFGLSDNPALLRRFEQLNLLALKAPWRRPSIRAPALSETFDNLVRCADRGSRQRLALDAILRMSNAQQGLFFEREGLEISLAAASGFSEAPAGVLARAREVLEDLSRGTTATLASGTHDERTRREIVGAYRILPLVVEERGQLHVLGAVALPENSELAPPALPELEEIARGLLAPFSPKTAAAHDTR